MTVGGCIGFGMFISFMPLYMQSLGLQTTAVGLARRLLRGGLGALVMLFVVFPVFYWIEGRLGKHWGGAAGMFVVQLYIMLAWPWVMKRFSFFNSRESENKV